jgi:ribosomal protein L7/L12
MNIEEAVNLVKPLIMGSTITKTEDFGDLFAVYFVNDEYYASRKMEDMMVGAGPMMVEKKTATVFATGSGQSAAEYAAAYKECGSVYGRPSSSVSISGSENDKAAILNLKSILSIGLKEAKNLVASINSSESVIINTESLAEAEAIVNKLKQKGFVAKQVWSVQC